MELLAFRLERREFRCPQTRGKGNQKLEIVASDGIPGAMPDPQDLDCFADDTKQQPILVTLAAKQQLADRFTHIL